jgi:hypothetical protein
MANIGSAAKAVEMELNHARQGMQYYTKLVENLEGVLETLSSRAIVGSGVRAEL